MSAAAAGSGAGVELSEAWTMEGGGSHHHTTSTIAAGVHSTPGGLEFHTDQMGLFSNTPSAAGECVVVLVTTVCAGILSPVAGGGAGAAELPAQVELRWGRPQS